MVFNFIGAIFIIKDYNNHSGNTTNLHITHTEYALSITQLIFVCITVWSLLDKYGLRVLLVPYVLNDIFNIIFSAFVINYYNNNWTFGIDFFRAAIAINVTFFLVLCNCIKGIKDKDKDKDKDKKIGTTSFRSGGQLARI